MPDPEKKKPNGDPVVAGAKPPPADAPFNAGKAKEHQEAWAKHLGVPVEITNAIGMKLRLIPPGEFDMGTRPEDVQKIVALLIPGRLRYSARRGVRSPQVSR